MQMNFARDCSLQTHLRSVHALQLLAVRPFSQRGSPPLQAGVTMAPPVSLPPFETSSDLFPALAVSFCLAELLLLRSYGGRYFSAKSCHATARSPLFFPRAKIQRALFLLLFSLSWKVPSFISIPIETLSPTPLFVTLSRSMSDIIPFYVAWANFCPREELLPFAYFTNLISFLLPPRARVLLVFDAD